MVYIVRHSGWVPGGISIARLGSAVECLFASGLVNDADGIESARADRKSSHVWAPCFDRVGCDRVGKADTSSALDSRPYRKRRGRRAKAVSHAIDYTTRPFRK